MAATNADIQRAVSQHRFREDLFYRLHVVPLRVPTLAERREDIRALASFFCESTARRHRLGGIELSPGVLRAAEVADWPGNVRQLAHAVEAAVIRAAGSGMSQVEVAHLFPDPPISAAEPRLVTFQEDTRRFQADFLHRALEDGGWNVSEVAQRLDLARSHVYNLIRLFNLTRNPR